MEKDQDQEALDQVSQKVEGKGETAENENRKLAKQP